MYFLLTDVLIILKKNGYYLIRHGKRHDIWFSLVTKKQFSVPRHKDEVKIGTLRAILEDVGIQ